MPIRIILRSVVRESRLGIAKVQFNDGRYHQRSSAYFSGAAIAVSRTFKDSGTRRAWHAKKKFKWGLKPHLKSKLIAIRSS